MKYNMGSLGFFPLISHASSATSREHVWLSASRLKTPDVWWLLDALVMLEVGIGRGWLLLSLCWQSDQLVRWEASDWLFSRSWARQEDMKRGQRQELFKYKYALIVEPACSRGLASAPFCMALLHMWQTLSEQEGREGWSVWGKVKCMYPFCLWPPGVFLPPSLTGEFWEWD